MPALEPLRRALRRASFAIWTVALTYALSVATGIVLVHSGHRPSLDYGDRLVGQAHRDSPILHQLQRGNRLMAAALDAAGNAFGGLASMAAGYCAPAGYGVTAYRGWIGGIMSVDSDHHSRLARPYDAFYYLVTLLLQLLPYSLAGGAGVNLGIAAFSANTAYRGPRLMWLRIPFEALSDARRIYMLALPLFALASLFEFLA